MLGATILNVPLDGMTDRDGLARLPELFGRASLALSMNVAFGYAVATVARSQLAGIGVGIGLYFAEGIAGIFLSDVFKWFPFSASGAVTSAGGDGGLGTGGGGQIGVTQLDPNTAIVVVGLWLVAALAVAALFTERAEIGG
jgi:hypothetical protein